MLSSFTLYCQVSLIFLVCDCQLLDLRLSIARFGIVTNLSRHDLRFLTRNPFYRTLRKSSFCRELRKIHFVVIYAKLILS